MAAAAAAIRKASVRRASRLKSASAARAGGPVTTAAELPDYVAERDAEMKQKSLFGRHRAARQKYANEQAGPLNMSANELRTAIAASQAETKGVIDPNQSGFMQYWDIGNDEFAKLRGVPDSPEALKGIPVGAPPAAAAHAASMRAGSAGAADESARARAQSSGAAMERLDRLMRIQNEMASELKSLAASVSAMGDAGGTPPRPPVTPKFSLFSA